MSRVAIIDNDVLANYHDIGQSGLLEQTRIVFSKIYIPSKVLSEFLNVTEPFLHSRLRFAENIGTDKGFFRHCNTFDPIVMGILQSVKNIHEGEAEAIAQAVRREISIILTDDLGCKTYLNANKHQVRCFGTLFLAALLDIHEFLPNARLVFQSIYAHHHFKASALREAYLQAFEYVGRTPDKKIISSKSSLKSILLT